jgi:putative zinc finger/helix-turn-helix YgiT family protein
MKPHPWKCGTCRAKAVNPVVIETYQTSRSHDNRAYDLEIPHLEAARCEVCGTIVLGDEAEGRVEEALRAKAGLLEPGAIRSLRESLGLTQKQLAEDLQIAESTLSRWETGAQIQQRAMDRFLRTYFQFSKVQAFLRSGAPHEDAGELERLGASTAIPSPVGHG